jgi:repressor LexA
MRTAQSDPEYLSRLQDHYARWRSVPAYDRLCQLWGLASRSAVGKVLERLRQQGFLERTPDGTWIPARRFFARFMARQAVQAGAPAADMDAGLTAMLLDELLVDTPSRTLLIPVRGDSMSGANILEGDVVVVERREAAPPGEIVVAVVDGELTVKRLGKDGQGWLLHPENPSFADIRPQGALELVGVVVGLARRLRKEVP